MRSEHGKMCQQGMKKFLHKLQPSSSGKENSMSADRTPHDMAFDGKTSKPEQIFDESEVTETSSVAQVDPSLYIQFVTEDLTSEAGPSEKYWEVISERRKIALLEALDEYQRLQTLTIALEEENVSLALLFQNTTSLVNSLTQMVNESQTSDNDETSDGQGDSGLSSPENHTSVQHVHKKMKISPDDCSDSD